MKAIRYAIAAVAVMALACLIFVSKPGAQQSPGQTQAQGAADAHFYSNGPVRKVDKNAANVSTPRMSDGHPSLTGFWPGGAQGTDDPAAAALSAAAIAAGNVGAGGGETTRTSDGSVFFDYAGPNGGGAPITETRPVEILPPYKPEYTAKVQKLINDQNGWGGPNINDPHLDCVPAGVPRAGFGGFVISSPEAVAILYEATPGSYYRIIYTDGRPHPTDYDTAYMGHSIGHWDGDTLVVDTVGLDDRTWLQGPGASIHSDKEHVIEKWTRKGNTVTVDVTVEDPVMFSKPWVLPEKQVALMTDDPSVYGNYILPAMCNTNDKVHFRVTGKQLCNWCNVESVYGGASDQTTQGKAIPSGATPADANTISK